MILPLVGMGEGRGWGEKEKGGEDKFVVRWELPPISFPCPSQACQSWEPRQIKLSGACRQTAPLTESVITTLGGA